MSFRHLQVNFILNLTKVYKLGSEETFVGQSCSSVHKDVDNVVWPDRNIAEY